MNKQHLFFPLCNIYGTVDTLTMRKIHKDLIAVADAHLINCHLSQGPIQGKALMILEHKSGPMFFILSVESTEIGFTSSEDLFIVDTLLYFLQCLCLHALCVQATAGTRTWLAGGFRWSVCGFVGQSTVCSNLS